MTDPKPVLAERLATWLAKVVEIGREPIQQDQEDCRASDDDCMTKSNAKAPELVLRTNIQPGELPHDAWVTPEQAESALGHNVASVLEDEVFEIVDEDQRHEEEALCGRCVNPTDFDYSSLCWSPAASESFICSAADIGWPESNAPRSLCISDFKCSMQQVVEKIIPQYQICILNLTRIFSVLAARLNTNAM